MNKDNKLKIGLLWNFEKKGLTTPMLRKVIEQDFKHVCIIINQLIKEVNPRILLQELRSIPPRLPKLNSGVNVNTNEFIQNIFKMYPKYSMLKLINNYCTDILKDINGMIIPGGSDIEAFIYNYKISILGKQFDNSDLRRTMIELFMLKNCLNKGTPLMGICRGCQIINVFYGGTIKNIDGENSDLYSSINKIISNNNTRFRIFQNNNELESVSLHNQCIDILGENLTITSVSVRNPSVIKSIESKSGSLVIGIQFHPEFYINLIGKSGEKALKLLNDNKNLFKYFFKECYDYRNKMFW